MSHETESFDDNEWTREELEQLQSLSAERVPPADLKARTAQLLRRRRLIGHRPAITVRLGFALAAAASVVFAAGAAVGYAAATRRATVVPVASETSTQAVARAESAGASPRPARQVVWF